MYIEVLFCMNCGRFKVDDEWKWISISNLVKVCKAAERVRFDVEIRVTKCHKCR